MGKLIDTDGLDVVLSAAVETFVKKSGDTVTGNLVFADNSGQINGYDIEGTSGNRWGIVPIVEKNAGAMEVGTYVRFHTSEADTTSGAVILQALSNGDLKLNGNSILTNAEYPSANISSQTNGAQAQFYAHNNCAMLTVGNDTTPSGQWGSKTLCTIPAGYRPGVTSYFPVAKTGNAQSDSYIMINASDGVVTLQNWGGTQSSVNYFSTCTWTY